jgi:hypothetical protein
MNNPRNKYKIRKCTKKKFKYSGGWLLKPCIDEDGNIKYQYVPKPRGGH